MDLLISFFSTLQKAAFAIGPFFLLLGVLIFIHELGHFVVARWFGVKVEVFSLGFGPKILKHKKGDTVYCISLLPLGGYVKMYGDNPLKEPPDSKKHQAFLYKKPYQKWLIAFAGPFVNLVFTVVAFFIMAVVGIPSLPPEIGDVKKASRAWEAGFRPGDTILSLNGQKLDSFTKLEELIQDSQGADLTFEVQSQNRQIKKFSLSPKQKVTESLLGEEKTVFGIEGLTPISTGLKLGVIYDSPAWHAGLRTFDTIQTVAGQKLKYWRNFKSLLEEENLMAMAPVKVERGDGASSVDYKARILPITVKREEEIEKFSMEIPTGSPSLKALGLEPSELYIETVGPDTPARRAGLKKADRLTQIDGKLLDDWQEVLEKIKSYKDETFSLTYRREGKETTVAIAPQAMFVKEHIKKRFMVGIRAGGESVFADPVLLKRSPTQSLLYATTETWKLLGLIVNYIARIVTGDISFRTLGGPVAIGQVAYQSFQDSFSSFFSMMALISLNLFFLNLLPIPALDGGHLLFFSIEGILRRPLNVKKLLVAQQVGVLLVFSFMGFVIFNDIYNWLKAW